MVSFGMFLKNTDEIGNQYLKDFVSDFLNINNQTLENYFPEAVKKTIPIEKKLVIKSYKKSEKNRDQVVNQEIKDAQKISYSFKGHKRHFYKKF